MDDLNKSPEQLAEDAKQVSRDAVSKARAVASDAGQVANDAIDTGGAYARETLRAANKSVERVRTHLSETTDYFTRVINAEPMKAVLVTAVISSAITALLVSALRSEDRYF